MKLTWFGGETLRVHLGGVIVVWRPAEVPGVSAEELVSGADIVVRDGDSLRAVDGTTWRPRRMASALEAGEGGGVVEVLSLGGDAGLIEAPGEPPLVIAANRFPPVGRWGRDAVVVALSLESARAALELAGPRLIALGLPGQDLEAAFDELRGRLGDTALMALEPGLALET